ncbi:MAG: coiled-coil domain-containing protein [Nitrososphaeraceae archaeon]
MPTAISKDTKNNVFHQWLKGKSRDEIANRNRISTGAVSNIIEEYRNNLNGYEIDALRQLSISINKSNLTMDQCFSGFRISKLMQRFGINQDNFEYFMNEIYKRCELLEISPDQIGNLLNEIIKLSKIIYPSQIPNHIKNKNDELTEITNKVEKEIKKLNDLNQSFSETNDRLNILLTKKNESGNIINWYNDLRKVLEENSIPFVNVQSFVNCIISLRKKNYDIEKIIKEYSEIENINELIKTQNEAYETRREDLEKLKEQEQKMNFEIEENRQKLTKLFRLEKMKFGIEELTRLQYTLLEFAKENNVNYNESVKKFFDGLEDYDFKQRFQKKLDDIIYEHNQLKMKVEGNKKMLQQQLEVIGKLNYFMTMFSTEDINNIKLIVDDIEKNYIDEITHALDKQKFFKDLEEFSKFKQKKRFN